MAKHGTYSFGVTPVLRKIVLNAKKELFRNEKLRGRTIFLDELLSTFMSKDSSSISQELFSNRSQRKGASFIQRF